MRDTVSNLKAHLPAAKCLPPSIDLNRLLDRPRMLDTLLEAWNHSAVLMLDGPPGQGKTVLALQAYLTVPGPRAWFNAGPEDHTPVVWILALMECIGTALPDLDLTPAYAVLENADEPVEKGRRTLNLLLKLLAADGRSLHLCFDRLEQIHGHDETLLLLQHLVTTAPPNLRFLLSGQRFAPSLEQAIEAFRCLHPPHQHLSFTMTETADLCRLRLQTELPPALLRALHEITAGWPLGVERYAEALRAWRDMSRGEWPRSLDDEYPDSVRRIFDAVLERLSDKNRLVLAAVAWLDSADVELLRCALDMPVERADITALSRSRQFFDEPLLGGEPRLHPLFRRHLRLCGDPPLAPHSVAEVLQRAAQFRIDNGDPTEALGYSLLKGDYACAERWIEHNLVPLLLQRHDERVHDLLTRIPESRLEANPYLTLLRSVTLLHKRPRQSHEQLLQVSKELNRRGDGLGELMALSYLMEYHIAVDGFIAPLQGLLERAKELYWREEENLSPGARLIACIRIASAASYAEFDTAKNQRYAGIALTIAQTSGRLDEEVLVRCVRVFDLLKQDDLVNAASQLEQLRAWLPRREISDFGHVLIRSASCLLLHARGFRNAFRRELERLQRHRPELYIRGVHGPTLFQNEALQALADGDDVGVLQHLERALSNGYAALSARLKSQLLQYRAYAQARLGHTRQARVDAEESRRLSEEAGGTDYIAINHLFIGATYRELGDWERAERELTTAIDLAEQIRPTLAAGAYAHRALGYLQQGKVPEAVYDTAAFLRSFRQQQSKLCIGWVPDVVEPVLGFAVSSGIEREYAADLAENLLGVFFDESGHASPVLRLYTLGRFELSIGGTRISAAELTPRAQQYLGSLAAAPNCELSREMLQETIWPEAGESSSKLYALRNRIKNLIDCDRHRQDADRYFLLRASIARLEHVWVDARAFEKLVQDGLSHWRRGEFWQASVLFREAEALWEGPFCSTTTTTEQIREYRNQIDRLNEQRVLHWADSLTARQEEVDAMEALSGYFDSDPANLEITARLARLQLRNGKTTALRRTLEQCRRALEQEGYEEEELRDILDSLVEDHSVYRHLTSGRA